MRIRGAMIAVFGVIAVSAVFVSAQMRPRTSAPVTSVRPTAPADRFPAIAAEAFQKLDIAPCAVLDGEQRSICEDRVRIAKVRKTKDAVPCLDLPSGERRDACVRIAAFAKQDARLCLQASPSGKDACGESVATTIALAKGDPKTCGDPTDAAAQERCLDLVLPALTSTKSCASLAGKTLQATCATKMDTRLLLNTALMRHDLTACAKLPQPERGQCEGILRIQP